MRWFCSACDCSRFEQQLSLLFGNLLSISLLFVLMSLLGSLLSQLLFELMFVYLCLICVEAFDLSLRPRTRCNSCCIIIFRRFDLCHLKCLCLTFVSPFRSSTSVLAGSGLPAQHAVARRARQPGRRHRARCTLLSCCLLSLFTLLLLPCAVLVAVVNSILFTLSSFLTVVVRPP